MPLLRPVSLLLCIVSLYGTVLADEDKPFIVMVYNVENLFDADGIALFNDYRSDSDTNPSPYSPQKVLTKIRHIAKNIAAAGEDEGPAILLFQEFEQDRSPRVDAFDYDGFLKQYTDVSLDQMLGAQFDEAVADLPAEALLLKYLEDSGMQGYEVAVGKAAHRRDENTAHNNVIFSRFPILQEWVKTTPDARPIQVVLLDVKGEPLILINNHWKSGASNSRTEKSRVANALDVRSILNGILSEDPYADVIVAGDLNTHYNAAEYFPTRGWTQDTYAIAVLGSQGDELAIRDVDGPDLYNLWFELPATGRGSELFQGSWGTLMQMLITRGLYDSAGIQYLDGSFRVVRIPGVTTQGPWDEPRAWHFSGNTGGGFSDHFPVAADFTIAGRSKPGSYIPLDNPSRNTAAPDSLPRVDYRSIVTTSLTSAVELSGLDRTELASRYGDIFSVKAVVVQTHPVRLKVGGHLFGLYSYLEEVNARLEGLKPGSLLRFYGQLNEYRGQPQFLIHDPSWLDEKAPLP